MTELMSRADIVRRRFEAMRMRWPERRMVFFQQEALILAWPVLMKYANMRKK